MNNIARALIELTLWLDEAEEPLDLRAMVKMLESVTDILHHATRDEIALLRRTVEELVEERGASSKHPAAVAEYYRRFVSDFGIDEPVEAQSAGGKGAG